VKVVVLGATHHVNQPHRAGSSGGARSGRGRRRGRAVFRSLWRVPEKWLGKKALGIDGSIHGLAELLGEGAGGPRFEGPTGTVGEQTRLRAMR
jgi:hypothetical protein